jgi:pyruvate formate lyase activating enzyme
MQFYKEEGEKLICLLCGHYCKLAPEQKGVCGVNQSDGKQIKNLVYGRPSAINIDPVEKKPLYHFLPQSKTFSIGTVGCNFQCSFCQNWQISQTDKIDTNNYFEPQKIVDLAIQNGCDSISYTYNEPTIFWPYIKDIVSIAKTKGLKNIMVSNGFSSFEVIEDMVGLIDAVNK